MSEGAYRFNTFTTRRSVGRLAELCTRALSHRIRSPSAVAVTAWPEGVEQGWVRESVCE